MSPWVVHIVLTMTDEDIPCTTYEDAEDLLRMIRFAIETKAAVRLDDGLVLNAEHIVKAWAEVVG